MRLNITRVRAEDFGEYQCVSKNEINTTAATFFIYGKRYIISILYLIHICSFSAVTKSPS